MSADKKFVPEAVINDLFDYVEQYRKASASLPKTGTLFPNQQVRGLWIELSLKTYLCAANKEIKTHDLCKLTKSATDSGLTLNESDVPNIIKPLNDIYFEGGPWKSKYLCRYPKPNRETLVTVTPTHEMIDGLIERIIDQAKKLRKA